MRKIQKIDMHIPDWIITTFSTADKTIRYNLHDEIIELRVDIEVKLFKNITLSTYGQT